MAHIITNMLPLNIDWSSPIWYLCLPPTLTLLVKALAARVYQVPCFTGSRNFEILTFVYLPSGTTELKGRFVYFSILRFWTSLAFASQSLPQQYVAAKMLDAKSKPHTHSSVMIVLVQVCRVGGRSEMVRLSHCALCGCCPWPQRPPSFSVRCGAGAVQQKPLI